MNFSLFFMYFVRYLTIGHEKLYLSILFLLAGVGSVFSQDVEQAVRERLQAFSKRISLSMSISVHAGSTVYLSISTENNPHLCR